MAGGCVFLFFVVFFFFLGGGGGVRASFSHLPKKVNTCMLNFHQFSTPLINIRHCFNESQIENSEIMYGRYLNLVSYDIVSSQSCSL